MLLRNGYDIQRLGERFNEGGSDRDEEMSVENEQEELRMVRMKEGPGSRYRFLGILSANERMIEGVVHSPVCGPSLRSGDVGENQSSG
jgi:hypothetical protein